MYHVTSITTNRGFTEEYELACTDSIIDAGRAAADELYYITRDKRPNTTVEIRQYTDSTSADYNTIPILYRVRTTFTGADGPTAYYFSDRHNAETFLNTCDNGNIDTVLAIADYPVPHADMSTLADLSNGDMDINIITI